MNRLPFDQQQLFMVVDVESIGLHGEGFAVAWEICRVALHDAPLEQGFWGCAPQLASGLDSDRDWVATHVPPLPMNCATPTEVRQHFWADWQTWSAQGALMLVDCGWPVETAFLSACLREARADLGFSGPFPLLDVATARTLLSGKPDTPSFHRAVQQHDPRDDVRATWLDWLHCFHICQTK